MTALVTSGHRRPALAAVRSLGRAKVAVAVCAPHRPALSFWSRYATSTVLVPSAEDNPVLFADAVAFEVTGRAVRCVLAGGDADLAALSSKRGTFTEEVARMLPREEAVARVLRRGTLLDLARSLGVPCVAQLRIDAAGDVEPALRETVKLGLPALVRPLAGPDDSLGRDEDAIPVLDIAELRKLLYVREDLVENGCLIEPRSSGPVRGYGVVCRGGEPVCEVFQRRLRERKVLSGVSAVAETTGPVAPIREHARHLLAALRWQGPAQLEFIETPRGPQLVQMVGRLWGSVALAGAAGVDVPLICYRLAVGETVTPGRVAASGHRLRWMMGDVLQAWDKVRGSRGARHTRLADRVGAVARVLDPREFKGTMTDVFAPDDPMPFVYELQGTGRHLKDTI